MSNAIKSATPPMAATLDDTAALGVALPLVLAISGDRFCPSDAASLFEMRALAAAEGLSAFFASAT
ncbi:MAG: hypothetical protein IPK60_17320 [Sandaracinaceae bacterium]|nr:hypothetical protein [Sandaracinaceae bacterium]